MERTQASGRPYRRNPGAPETLIRNPRHPAHPKSPRVSATTSLIPWLWQKSPTHSCSSNEELVNTTTYRKTMSVRPSVT